MLIILLHKEQLNKILQTYIILTWQLRLKKDENALIILHGLDPFVSRKTHVAHG